MHISLSYKKKSVTSIRNENRTDDGTSYRVNILLACPFPPMQSQTKKDWREWLRRETAQKVILVCSKRNIHVRAECNDESGSTHVLAVSL
jgi:hypothetical protein